MSPQDCSHQRPRAIRSSERGGRWPVALLIAFAASLGLHATALFVPEVNLSSEPENPILFAELRPAKPEESVAQAQASPPPSAISRDVAPRRRSVAKKAVIARKTDSTEAPVARLPEVVTHNAETSAPPPESDAPDDETPALTGGSDGANLLAAGGASRASGKSTPPTSARLPPAGRIVFRVERGDSEFVIGVARQEWLIEDGRYRLMSSAETTGLAWLIRAVDINMESIGRLSSEGFQPEAFGIMRSGKKARERALFDWESRRVRVSDNNDYSLDTGAQDLLSLYYQVGYLDIAPGESVLMPIATGKKYQVYRLENLGDETLTLPLGDLRTRHLRTSGERPTDLWLAYDYRLLPVKIRHVDNRGNAYVQVATEILFGQ